jgi:hypothetical protein
VGLVERHVLPLHGAVRRPAPASSTPAARAAPPSRRCTRTARPGTRPRPGARPRTPWVAGCWLEWSGASENEVRT